MDGGTLILEEGNHDRYLTELRNDFGQALSIWEEAVNQYPSPALARNCFGLEKYSAIAISTSAHLEAVAIGWKEGNDERNQKERSTNAPHARG